MYFTTFSSDNSTLNPDGNPNRLLRYFNPAYDGVCGMSTDMKYANSPKVNGSSSMSMMPTRYLLTLYHDADGRYDNSFLEGFIQNATSWTWTQDMIDIFKKPSSFLNNITIMKGDTAAWYTRKVIPQTVKDKLPYAVVDLDMVYDPVTGAIRDNADMFSRFYPRLNKYNDYNRTSVTAASTNDVCVIRFAEMFLIAAEASMQLGDQSTAANYINQLRQRAAKKGSLAEIQVSASDMTIYVMIDERARKLCV